MESTLVMIDRIAALREAFETTPETQYEPVYNKIHDLFEFIGDCCCEENNNVLTNKQFETLQVHIVDSYLNHWINN